MTTYRILPTERAWRLAWFLVWLERQDQAVIGDYHRLLHGPFPAWLWFYGQWVPPVSDTDDWLVAGVDWKNRPGGKHRPRKRAKLTFWGKIRKTVLIIRRHRKQQRILRQRLQTYVTRRPYDAETAPARAYHGRHRS